MKPRPRSCVPAPSNRAHEGQGICCPGVIAVLARRHEHLGTNDSTPLTQDAFLWVCHRRQGHRAEEPRAPSWQHGKPPPHYAFSIPPGSATRLTSIRSPHFAVAFAMPTARRRRQVYTKTGDGGSSQLFTGERRSKSDPVFEALGSTDELNGHLGVAREHAAIDGLTKLDGQLQEIMSRLVSTLPAPLPTPPTLN